MQERFDLVHNYPGSVPRLGLHAGSTKAYYDFGLPRPDKIIASSAGAMTGSAVIGWDELAFDRNLIAIGNLSPGQIFSFRRQLKVKLAALGISTVGLGALILFDHKLSKGKKAMFGLAGLATILGIDWLVGQELVHSESHLDPGPLSALLYRELDFRAIFNSTIELEIVVADVRKPGMVVFSNHHSLNSDHTSPAHRERWVDILLASARLPGKFPFINIDGIATVDGEVWTDFPIQRMKQHKRIIRFDYWSPLQPDSAPREWMSDLTRSFDIMRDRVTQEEFDNYRYERALHPELPEVFCVRSSPRLLKAMPKIRLHDFTPDQMKVLEEVGYETVRENLPDIKRYLEA